MRIGGKPALGTWNTRRKPEAEERAPGLE